MIRLEGVEVRYGDALAVAATDLEFAQGSFTSLLGPTGCGKSTLLNVVAGFVPPSGGRALMDGAPVTGPGSDRGMVFQHYALLPWFTARGNVEFALKRFGLPRAERRAHALRALDDVGLADAAEKYPAQLSGGMRQRVALARALAAEPRVLLMDEPFGALDAITRRRMQQLLAELWRRTGTTVVLVTHDVDEALVLSQRIVVMAAGPGRVIADHRMDDGTASPEDTRPRIVAQLDTEPR
ncbi:ABC transporter ATP-binding protein [Streptomyces alanosinicus]|uniref:ABC transporter ATP-binding protein n=1 Tax=Streptomyces alanosinicus TaxID=68171 RepID=A0A918YF62_9ACTN|nr:ABC transporter ATP-binding protein [Streptomyces alanosinicus]GHE00889.1 ABC transporter ATP-binding protein [Streptomyces alanosinicus]